MTLPRLRPRLGSALRRAADLLDPPPEILERARAMRSHPSGRVLIGRATVVEDEHGLRLVDALPPEPPTVRGGIRYGHGASHGDPSQ